MMKKFLLACFALFLLVAVALGVFIATFDIDRYRPRVVAELEKVLGVPITLDRITLGWNNGVAIQLRGLSISQPSGEQPPLLEMDEASALVQLRPLLHRELRVSTIRFVRPRVHIVRKPGGEIDATGLAMLGAPGAAGGHSAAVEGTPISFEIASLKIQDGTVQLIDQTSQPPRDVWIRSLNVTVRNIAPDRPMDIEASAAFAGEQPNIYLQGRVRLPSPSSAGSLEQVTARMEAIPLEQLLPAGAPDAPRLEGEVSVTLRGEVATLDPAYLLRAVVGSGTLRLDHAVLRNLNVLRTVFDKFSMIPGLASTLQEDLPPDYQEKMAAQDTVLEPIDLAMRLESGILHFDELQLRTDTFAVVGSGWATLEGAVGGNAWLRLDPTLTSAMVASVRELQALRNRSGEMEIPVTIQGQMPQLAVVPDVNYITQKVIMTTAVDAIRDLLRRELAPEETPGTEPKAQASAGDTSGEPVTDSRVPSSTEELLGHFLRRALAPEDNKP